MINTFKGGVVQQSFLSLLFKLVKTNHDFLVSNANLFNGKDYIIACYMHIKY